MKSQIEIDPTATISSTVKFYGEGRIKISAYCVIEDHVIIDTGSGPQGSISIGSRSKIKVGSILRGYGNGIYIGHRVSLGEHCLIAGHGGVKIDNYTIIGPHTIINAASHIVEGEEPFRFQGETARGIHIGHDVWIGVQCTILDNTTIGSHSVIGAHSLVKKNIASHAVAFGIPATIHKMINRGEIKNESSN